MYVKYLDFQFIFNSLFLINRFSYYFEKEFIENILDIICLFTEVLRNYIRYILRH